MNPGKFRTLLVSAALALAGCAFGHREDLVVLAPGLSQGEAPTAPAAPRPWQLVVAEPRAVAPLDGTRILVMPTPGEIQFYKGVRWRDATPAMLQDLFVQAFRNTGLPGTGVPAGGLRADLLLRTDLEQFQAEYRGAQAPTVVVRISAQLIRDGTVVAAHVFEVEEACADEHMPEVFAAFQRAIDKATAAMVAWTIAAGDAAGTPRRGMQR